MTVEAPSLSGRMPAAGPEITGLPLRRQFVPALVSEEVLVPQPITVEVPLPLDSSMGSVADRFSRLRISERKMIMALGEGAMTNDDIAIVLDITEQTVKNELYTAFELIGAYNRTEAALMYASEKERKQREAMFLGQDPEEVDVFGPFRDKRKFIYSDDPRRDIILRYVEGEDVDIDSALPFAIDPSKLSSLTGAENRVMNLFVTSGASASDKQLAASLSRSDETVHHHFQSVFRKLGVGNRLDAAAVYLKGRRLGLI